MGETFFFSFKRERERERERDPVDDEDDEDVTIKARYTKNAVRYWHESRGQSS